MRPSSAARRTWLLVGALTLAACVCRVPLLLHGIWRDEASTFFDVTAPTLAGTLREITSTEITPPGFFLFMRGWVALFGTSEVVLKLPACVFGVALVPATYALARLLGSRGAALLAAGFAAFSLEAISLSTEARAYTLGALLGALALTLGLRYLSSQAGSAYVAAYGIAAAACAYVHYTGVVLLAAFALGCCAFFARRVLWRKLAFFIAFNALVGAAVLPWLPHAANARHATFLERGGPTFAGSFVEQLGFVLPVDFMHVQYAFALLVALAAGCVRYVRRGPASATPAETRFVAASLALLAGTLAETVLSLHEQRYMFAFTPLGNALGATSCWALLAPAVARARGAAARVAPLRAALGAALLVTALAGMRTEARAFGRLYGPDRSGIRRLARESFPAFDARTLVVVAPDYLAPTLGYYLRDRSDLAVVGVPQWDSPGHAHCCVMDWRDPRLVDALAERIVAATRSRYHTVAYVYDLGAYDEGPVPYSKIFALRVRLGRLLRASGERRYDGSKESVGLTLFRARTR